MFNILLYTVGLTLSATAAFYSVTGLAYIFAGSFWSIVFMGSTLEAAKLMGASWTFRHWRTAPRPLTAYISAGVVVLILLTGIGVYGYLTKSYLTQQAPVAAMSADLAAADRTVALAQEQYDRDVAAMRGAQDSRSATSVIDRLATNGRLTGNNGAVSVLRQQQTLQRTLQTSLTTSATALKDAETARATLQRSFAEQTVDVGPLMFVAKAWYGTADIPTLDRAVRWLILLIMSAFDPMAIALLLAAQYTSGMTASHKPLEQVRASDPTPPTSDPPMPVVPPGPMRPSEFDAFDVPTAAEFSAANIEPVTDITIEDHDAPEAAEDIPAPMVPPSRPAPSRWKIGRRRTRTAPKT